MKLIELNNTLSELFGETIILTELIDQSAKKWYEKEYINSRKITWEYEFKLDFVYGVIVSDIIQFDFCVKSYDNLFKSFFNNFVSKYYCKRYDFETGEFYTKERAISELKLKFDNARVSNGLMYSTNYGIGVWNIMMPKKWIDYTCESIEKKLNELNIKYTTEFSEAYWVFRYCFDGNYIDHNKIVESIKLK